MVSRGSIVPPSGSTTWLGALVGPPQTAGPYQTALEGHLAWAARPCILGGPVTSLGFPSSVALDATRALESNGFLPNHFDQGERSRLEDGHNIRSPDNLPPPDPTFSLVPGMDK